MENQIIHHRIKKEDEGRYYTLGFDVPEGVNHVAISYSYPKAAKGAAKNIVDLGLIDADGRFLGWSGSARDHVFVGEYASTPGYLTERIKSGRWQIIIGAYHIDDRGLDVVYEISFGQNRPKLFFGDLHVHSTASDGRHDVCTLAKMAKQRGLDFLAIADHNNFAQNLTLPQIPGLTLIPAVEWTHYRGHMNLFGVARPFENTFIANSEQEMQAVIAHAKSLGALVSANHPKCGLCPYLWKDEGFDLVEVWNGPMRPANLRAVVWWTELLRQGKRIPAVGGSDFHRNRRVVRMGNPVTAVFADSPRAEDILSAVSKGHCFITESTRGPKLSLCCNNAMMGDSIKVGKGDMLEINASDLRSAQLLLVTDNGEREIPRPANGESVSIPVENLKFAYLKAVSRIFGKEYIRAISNPIYFEN